MRNDPSSGVRGVGRRAQSQVVVPVRKVYERFLRSGKPYQFFLCHHKAPSSWRAWAQRGVRMWRCFCRLALLRPLRVMSLVRRGRPEDNRFALFLPCAPHGTRFSPMTSRHCRHAMQDGEGWVPFYRRRRDAALARRERARRARLLFQRACAESRVRRGHVARDPSSPAAGAAKWRNRRWWWKLLAAPSSRMDAPGGGRPLRLARSGFSR